jgi:truncated hemoglobin YjbI
MTSLYDQLGQEPAVTEAVKRFYVRVLDDPALTRFFEGVDVDKLQEHQVALFTKILGGPDNYSGRALDAAHRGLGITDEQYALVGGHLIAVLDELGAGEVAIDAVKATLADVKPNIVEAADA